MHTDCLTRYTNRVATTSGTRISFKYTRMKPVARSDRMMRGTATTWDSARAAGNKK